MHTITFRCTDRGTHKPAKLTVVVVDDDGNVTSRVGAGFYPPGYVRDDGEINQIYVFRCWRCPRTMELTAEKYDALLSLLLKRGVSRADISRSGI